jgi:uncharacterized protein YjiK
MMKSAVIYLICLIIAISQGEKKQSPSRDKKSGYDLESPDVIIYLPDILREISGITILDNSSVACIQDENGILFIYDLAAGKIKSQFKFGADGDYEGIARVGKTIYVLRSDGTLFEISDYTSSSSKVSSYNTGIPAKDNEGLCYDRKNNRLLIGCKGKVGNDDKDKHKRMVFVFSLKTKTLIKEPLLTFDVKELREFAAGQKKGGDGKEPEFNLETSAIGIHPITGKLYLLSASDNLLFVFNMNGKIEAIEKLKNKLFPQAEGITFLSTGDMLISNEGRDKEGTILRFNYK